jgi:hypothetical protein
MPLQKQSSNKINEVNEPNKELIKNSNNLTNKTFEQPSDSDDHESDDDGKNKF